MQRTLLKSKIHRATVTGAELHYEGSVTVDRELLEAADIRENEQVQIYSVTSGARLTTYAIAGEPGEGEVRINGAAAHLIREGEMVIIASYAQYAEAEAAVHEPKVVRVDERNHQRFHPHLPSAGAPLRGARFHPHLPSAGAPLRGTPDAVPAAGEAKR